MNNLQKYGKELDSLIRQGERLEVAIVHECSLGKTQGINVEKILDLAERIMGWSAPLSNRLLRAKMETSIYD